MSDRAVKRKAVKSAKAGGGGSASPDATNGGSGGGGRKMKVVDSGAAAGGGASIVTKLVFWSLFTSLGVALTLVYVDYQPGQLKAAYQKYIPPEVSLLPCTQEISQFPLDELCLTTY